MLLKIYLNLIQNCINPPICTKLNISACPGDARMSDTVVVV